MKAEKNRLWRVWTAENVCHSNIEAPDVGSAIHTVVRNDPEKYKKVLKVTSEPIYQTGLDVECDGPKLKSENAVFEINLRGTDPECLEKLKQAIALAIGDPMFDEAPNPGYLIRMLEGPELDLSVIAM